MKKFLERSLAAVFRPPFAAAVGIAFAVAFALFLPAAAGFTYGGHSLQEFWDWKNIVLTVLALFLLGVWKPVRLAIGFPLVAILALYLPAGILYGNPSILVAMALLQTNPTEAGEFLTNIPLRIYAEAAGFFLLGAAAQFGVFAAFFMAMLWGFNDAQSAAIGIIGGADGPTSIFLAMKLGQRDIMGPIAVAAYSYMSLVPIIQPPIMKALTTEEERKIKMEQLRFVSKRERILFPIVVTIVVCVILPSTAPLIGMLMLGNLFRESGVVRQLQETASNALMYIVVIFLGTSVGATTSAEAFLKATTLKIVVLGLVAFAFGTATGVLFGKLMCKLTGGKINPLIGSAGVSAVPMAARVSQKVGAEADPTNFLLMHAMGPNVAGVIGTAVAAGVFMAIFGVQ